MTARPTSSLALLLPTLLRVLLLPTTLLPTTLLPALLLPVLLLLGMPLPGAAAPAQASVALTGREDGLRLAPYAQVLEDPGRQLGLAQVRAATAGWKSHTGRALGFGISHSAWWVRLPLQNTSASAQAMVVSLGNATQDFVHWTVLGQDGATLLDNSSGDRLPFSSRLLQNRDLGLPLTLAPRQSVELYIHLDTHDGLYEAMPLAISGAAAFAAHSDADNVLFSLYHGGMLALLLYNLLLYLSTRERSFGLYVLYLATFLLNSVCFRGYDLAWLWPDRPDLHNRLTGFSAALSFTAAGLFVIGYLRLREHAAAWCYRLSMTVTALSGAGCLFALSGFYALTSVWCGVAGLMMVALIFALSLLLFRRGVRAARFVLPAFSILALGVLMYNLEGAAVLPTSGWSIWGIQICSTIEMLLLALGLADAMNVLKAKALQAERAAREAQQALAADLGRLVDERTEALLAANNKLNALAITDELTGVFNRRHFNHICRLTLDRRRRGEPLALCIFDLDNFKSYNDTYGHLAGDEVLRNIAACAQKELRRSGDQLFRLGGEEFGVLFTAVTPEAARQFIERLRAALAALAIGHAGNRAGIVTASFGVIWWNPHAEIDALQPNQLYAAADSLLYKAKGNGRDTVVLEVL